MKKSKNFNIEDIHRIRYENYEATKNLTREELIKKTSAEADKFLSRLKKRKENIPILKN